MQNSTHAAWFNISLRVADQQHRCCEQDEQTEASEAAEMSEFDATFLVAEDAALGTHTGGGPPTRAERQCPGVCFWWITGIGGTASSFVFGVPPSSSGAYVHDGRGT